MSDVPYGLDTQSGFVILGRELIDTGYYLLHHDVSNQQVDALQLALVDLSVALQSGERLTQHGIRERFMLALHSGGPA